MKKKDLEDIRNKEVSGINKNLAEKRKGLDKIMAEMHTGNEKNLKKAKNLRREIAQMLTIIKEKELIAQNLPKLKEK